MYAAYHLKEAAKYLQPDSLTITQPHDVSSPSTISTTDNALMTNNMTTDTLSVVGQRRDSKAVSSKAILEAAKIEEGDDDKNTRVLRPIMEPVEIDTKKNIAAFLLGEKWGAMMRPSTMTAYMQLVFGWCGSIVGLLTLFKVLPSYWAIIGGLMMLPNLIFNCYLQLILPLLSKLLNRFDTL